MTDNRLKVVNFRVPIDLLARMSEVRKNEGITVTFQFIKGAELYLLAREKKRNKT